MNSYQWKQMHSDNIKYHDLEQLLSCSCKASYEVRVCSDNEPVHICSVADSQRQILVSRH